MAGIQFYNSDPNEVAPSDIPQVFLKNTGWDDWFMFATEHSIRVRYQGQIYLLGTVKIGSRGLAAARASADPQPGTRKPQLPNEFTSLPPAFFSVGTSESYYESALLLPDGICDDIFKCLRDCAYDLSIFEESLRESVMQNSLLRATQETTVRNRFHRLATGVAELTPYAFRFAFPKSGLPEVQEAPASIDFNVVPNSSPPTNVHVIIGRNGVGKTRCLNLIANAYLAMGRQPAEGQGTLQPIGQDQGNWGFTGLVSVSFSAFDDRELPDNPNQRVVFVGLRAKSDVDGVYVKTPDLLAEEFCASVEKCLGDVRSTRWLQAISNLENDPLFAEAQLSLLPNVPSEQIQEYARAIFRRCSSGHKITLLTITKLVELVGENTLVLLDEPEGHLHPPLLSAFMRSLSELLTNRNGVAVIATHSPVVLQEVPATCVTILRRTGRVTNVDPPRLETFGENVGILTHEVFRLEVQRTGFYRRLIDAVNNDLSFEQITAAFGDQIGGEGKAILRVLISQRERHK